MINPDLIFGRLGNRLFQGAYVYAQMKRGLVNDIFVQDYRHFDKYKEEIQKLYGEGIGYLPYVAIHLRRGDYVGNKFYTPLWETGYYIDAIAKFPDRKFLIFSDDIPFAKIYFEGDKFAFDDSTDDLESFNRMASCSDFIIANSSFSFMAAYIAPSISKKIIAPTYDKWYSDGNKTRTVIPPDWIQV